MEAEYTGIYAPIPGNLNLIPIEKPSSEKLNLWWEKVLSQLPIPELCDFRLSHNFQTNVDLNENFALIVSIVKITSEILSGKIKTGMRQGIQLDESVVNTAQEDSVETCKEGDIHFFLVNDSDNSSGKQFRLASLLWDGAVTDKLSLGWNAAKLVFYEARGYNKPTIRSQEKLLRETGAKIAAEINLLEIYVSYKIDNQISRVSLEEDPDSWITATNQTTFIKYINITPMFREEKAVTITQEQDL